MNHPKSLASKLRHGPASPGFGLSPGDSTRRGGPPRLRLKLAAELAQLEGTSREASTRLRLQPAVDSESDFRDGVPGHLVMCWSRAGPSLQPCIKFSLNPEKVVLPSLESPGFNCSSWCNSVTWLHEILGLWPSAKWGLIFYICMHSPVGICTPQWGHWRVHTNVKYDAINRLLHFWHNLHIFTAYFCTFD